MLDHMNPHLLHWLVVACVIYVIGCPGFLLLRKAARWLAK